MKRFFTDGHGSFPFGDCCTQPCLCTLRERLWSLWPICILTHCRSGQGHFSELLLCVQVNNRKCPDPLELTDIMSSCQVASCCGLRMDSMKMQPLLPAYEAVRGSSEGAASMTGRETELFAGDPENPEGEIHNGRKKAANTMG